jgi:hypothetical protein
MAHMYEVNTPMLGRAVFEFAFVRYLESIGYHHMRAGDWAGGQTSHEFRRGDELVALSIASEGHVDCRIVVESDTVPVEPLVVEVLTEGLADSLQVFGDALNVGDAKEKMLSLARALRDAFPGDPAV